MLKPSLIAPDSRIAPSNHCLTSHEREGRQRAGVAAGAGADQDQSVHTLLGRLVRMLGVDHVVENEAAVGMRGRDDLGRRPQRGDDDRHPMLHAGLHVLHQPAVGGVTDLVHGIGRDLAARMARFVLAELVIDPGQPLVEHAGRPGIERGE